MQISVFASFEIRPLQPILEFWLRRLGWNCQVDLKPTYQVVQQLISSSPNLPGVDVVLVRPEDLDASQLAPVLRARTAATGRRCLACCCRDGGAAQPEPIPGVEWLKPEQLALYHSGGPMPVSSELPFSELYYTALATALVRALTPSIVKPIKLMVVDADNTLWDGVVAEDGVHSIRMRADFQAFLRAQVEAGCLLAVCSKNQREDLEAVFSVHTEMGLEARHVLAWLVGWESKSSQILQLLEQLNLGAESVLAFDDNAVEVAEIRAAGLQAVQVPQAAHVPDLLQHLWWFDQAQATPVDARRTELYREQAQRDSEQSRAASLADFVAGLNMEIRLKPLEDEHLERASQLTYRTNQFHLSPRTRTPAEWAGGLGVWVSDRIGDYGLVGLVMLEEGKVATLLLSCRVLGRGVEHAVLSQLKADSDSPKLQVAFHSSPRNQPAARFLEELLGAHPQEGWNELSGDFRWNPTRTSPSRPAPSRPQLTGACPQLCQVAESQWLADQILALAQARPRRSRPALAQSYLPPRQPREAQVAQIWEEILAVEPVGAMDGFFELGGDSLAMVSVLNRLQQLWGSAPSLDHFLRNPTVAGLAEESPVPSDRVELSWVSQLSDEEVESLLSQMENETSIDTVVIPTAGRPEALLRAVGSFHQHLRQHGRPTRLLITDQSTAVQSAQTRPLLAELARKHSIDLVYAGWEEHQQIRQGLVTQGFSPELVTFALGGGELQGCGSNRNMMLLLCGPTRLLSVDDDTLASQLVYGDIQAPVRYAPGAEAEDITYFGEPVAQTPGPVDLLTLHERLLGRAGLELGDWPQLRPDAWVAATFNGLHGDCGLGAPFGLWEEPLGLLALNQASHRQLVQSEAHYREALLSRHHLRLAPVPTVSNGVCTLSTFMAMDASRVNAPWWPALRGTDRLFPALVSAIHPEALYGHVPVAAPHQPLQERRFSPGELFRNAGGIDVSRFFLECIRLWKPGDLSGAIPRLNSLGAHLQELASQDFSSLLLPALRQQNATFAARLRERTGPLWWRDDLEEYFSRVEKAQQKTDYWIPVDVQARLGAEAAAVKTRDLLRLMGQLLQAWPQLLEAVEHGELRQRCLNPTATV
jgi:FkbH-like protein